MQPQCPGEPGVLKEHHLLLENQSPGKEICVIYFSFYKVIIEFSLIKCDVFRSMWSDTFVLFWRAAKRISQDPAYP